MFNLALRKYEPFIGVFGLQSVCETLPTIIMRAIRLIFTFYKSFAFASLMITLTCISIIYTWGIDTFTALFWFKIITLGLIFYFTNSFKKDEFYYYKNFGLTKMHLWAPTLIFDFILFLILIALTFKIR